LVEQGLEEVVVLAVEESDLHRDVLEGLSSVETAKAAANDDDAMDRGGRHGHGG
jgi:hypothetical protein